MHAASPLTVPMATGAGFGRTVTPFGFGSSNPCFGSDDPPTDKNTDTAAPFHLGQRRIILTKANTGPLPSLRSAVAGLVVDGTAKPVKRSSSHFRSNGYYFNITCTMGLMVLFMSITHVGAVFTPTSNSVLKTAINDCLTEDGTGNCLTFAGQVWDGGSGGGSGDVYGTIDSWDVSKITDMSSIFEDKSSFNSDISKWNVEAVTNMNKSTYALFFFPKQRGSV